MPLRIPSFLHPNDPLEREEEGTTEERVPLTSLTGSPHLVDSPIPASIPPSKRSPPSSSSTKGRIWGLIANKRTVGVLILAGILYQFADYLYSDPERWSSSSSWFSPEEIISVSHIVHANGREYSGTSSPDSEIVSWWSIPYALPPIGERRFRRPVKLGMAKMDVGEDWEFVDAREEMKGEGCPRLDKTGNGFVGKEDCLTLNIASSAKRRKGELLPVMLWIHGGGFSSGSSIENRYNPHSLILKSIQMNQPILFVSINYRLGALGFSASPPIPGGDPYPPHVPIRPPEDLDLNVGFKDQIMAMEWVKEEIEHFGGDKERVTIVGHSAGAMSVGLHLIYSDPSLFRAAFMLSGAPTSFPVPWPHDAAYRTIHPLPDPMDCPWPIQNGTSPPINTDLISCMRSLPLSEFMESHKFMLDRAPKNAWFPWYPVLEGEWEGSWLDTRPSMRIQRGTFAKIPVVLGGVKDEGTRFMDVGLETKEDIMEALRGTFDFTYGAIEGILEPLWSYYPANPSLGSPYNTGNETFGLSPTFKRASSIFGDLLFDAPRRHLLRETAKDFGQPSWNYYYEEARPGAEPRNGAQHAADLASWFGNLESDDPDLHHLSRHMTAYLINFVANMDPNGPGLRTWPQYGIERKTLHLAKKNITTTHDNARLEAMRFINRNAPIFAR